MDYIVSLEQQEVGATYMTTKQIHLAKTITWRVIASTTTFLITWAVTGEIEAGLFVGGFEAVAKMFLYYEHERFWHRHAITALAKK